MNAEFYQQDAQEIVEEQEYYKRDSTGFVGKAAYPESAKLNTKELGKVAVNIFEGMRAMREYKKEQFTKGLNIIKKDDDISELLFKMFEQMRLLNEDLSSHISVQQQKKTAIRTLEDVLMTEHDYAHLINTVRNQDNMLYEISQKFTDLTKEAKRILDNIKDKSQQRKQNFGVDDGQEKPQNHHRPMPQDVKEKLQATTKEVSKILILIYLFQLFILYCQVENLHLSFDKFTLQTQSAVFSLHESQERVLAMRQDASISGNKNIF